MGRSKNKPKYGRRFVSCPGCGNRERWRAVYQETVAQFVDLRRSKGGGVQVVEWQGGLKTFDDSATEDIEYQCHACGHTIPADTHHPEHVLSRIQRLLSGKDWRPETRDRIVEELRAAGYTIEEPKGKPPRAGRLRAQ